MNKVLPYNPPILLLIAGVITKFRAAMKIQIPVGYQDQTGFHLGVQPAEETISWPPAE